MIADNISAFLDVWFIGDVYLKEVHNTFQGMLNRAKLDRKSWQPYLLEYYNPKAYYYSSSNWLTSVMSRILNKLIEALNENEHLPKFIIFMPDKDLISDLKSFDYGATKNLENITNWLMRQCDITIQRKRLQMSEKKPGAIWGNSPTIIYMTMVHRIERFPHGSRMAGFCSIRPKFNDIINECASRNGHKVLHISTCNTFNNFDRMGNLTPQGKSSLWHEIDDAIERYEDPSDSTTLNPMTPRKHLQDYQRSNRTTFKPDRFY